MSFLMEIAIMTCHNWIHVKHKVRAPCKFGWVIATARSWVLSLCKSRRFAIHGCLIFLLLEFENVGCQGLEKTSKVFDFTCFLVLFLFHSRLRPPSHVFGVLSWFSIYNDSNNAQIFLHINCLLEIFQKCWFHSSLNELHNVGRQCRRILVNCDGVVRFGVRSELVQDMVKPLIKIFQFFFLLHLEATNSFNNMASVLSSKIFSRKIILNIAQFSMEYTGRLWYHIAAFPSKVHGNSPHATSS